LVQAVIEKLKMLGGSVVTENPGVQESIVFEVPAELRVKQIDSVSQIIIIKKCNAFIKSFSPERLFLFYNDPLKFVSTHLFLSESVDLRHSDKNLLFRC